MGRVVFPYTERWFTRWSLLVVSLHWASCTALWAGIFYCAAAAYAGSGVTPVYVAMAMACVARAAYTAAAKHFHAKLDEATAYLLDECRKRGIDPPPPPWERENGGAAMR